MRLQGVVKGSNDVVNGMKGSIEVERASYVKKIADLEQALQDALAHSKLQNDQLTHVRKYDSF